MPTKRRTKHPRKPPAKLPPARLLEDRLIVPLPIPPIALRPNGGHGHWRVKNRARKDAKATATLAALSALAGTRPPAIAYSLHYHFHSHRWDDDNAIASVKSYLDGIAAALGMDDRYLRFRELFTATDRHCPRVEIIVFFGCRMNA